MRFSLGLLVALLALAAAFAVPAHAGGRIGGGVHYLNTVGEISDSEGFDENALGFLASYQHDLGLIKLEGDVEWIMDYGGSDEALIQPQVFGLLGNFIYGGAGIGWTSFDGEWWPDPFYSLRAGVDFMLFGLDLDAYGLYRFQTTEVFEGLGDESVDSITLGAQIRFQLGD